VLCFGDSWTHGNSVALTQQLRESGHENVQVVSEDYWGSTAEYFAHYSSLLPDAVTKHRADYVLLSMGGNDFKNIYWFKKRYIAPGKAVAEIECHIRVVLDALYARHPNIKVVTYGYDFPGNIDTFLTGTFWGGAPKLSASMRFLLFLYNYIGVRFINSSLMKLGKLLAKLSKEYTAKGHTFTYIPLWGTLQKAALPADKKASIKMGCPSPPQFMDDPIHANYQGFSHLLAQLYANYFKPNLTATLAPIIPAITG